MPFDGSPRTPTREEFHAASPRERLIMLRDALREESHFAKFRWEFNIIYAETPCGTIGCAMGLAQHLWDFCVLTNTNFNIHGIADTFGLPHKTVLRLFYGHGNQYGRLGGIQYGEKVVSPGEVADAIDAYLKICVSPAKTEIIDAI